MKFTRTHGIEKVDNYGRWVSDCNRFSVQRFVYKREKGASKGEYVKPYFSVYALINGSRQFKTNLHNWREVVDACEKYLKEDF